MDSSLISLIHKPNNYIFGPTGQIIVKNQLCDNDDNIELSIPKINGKYSQFNKNSNKYYFEFKSQLQKKLFQLYLDHFGIKYEDYLEINDTTLLDILTDEECPIDLPPVEYEIKKADDTEHSYERGLWLQHNYRFKSYKRNILESGKHEIILNMNWDFNLEIQGVNDDNFLITLENRGCSYYNLYGYEKNTPTEIIRNGEKIHVMRKQVKYINDGENIAVRFEATEFPMYIVNNYINKEVLEIGENSIKVISYNDKQKIAKETTLKDVSNQTLTEKIINWTKGTCVYSPMFSVQPMEYDFCNRIVKTEDAKYHFLTINGIRCIFFENRNIVPVYFNKGIAMLNGENDKYIAWEVGKDWVFSPSSF